MKLTRNSLPLARAAAVALVGLAGPSAFATGVATTYNSGDLFIGFRQNEVANTLSVNIGSATKYLLPSLGGTWNGDPFQVQFGIVPAGNPNAGAPVFSLAADLTAVFTGSWAQNNLAEPQNDVSWAVVGVTSNSSGSPLAGYGAQTAFLTKAAPQPGTQSSVLGSISNSTFYTNVNSFIQGGDATSYLGRISTDNSSVAYIGGAGGTNNWGARISASSGSFGAGASRPVEQANGDFSGPTNSVLDLYIAPGSGSSNTGSSTSSRTYLGSFVLGADGTVTYGNYSAVPEPSSMALLGVAAASLGFTRRRRAADAVSAQS